ncbi:MAG: NAD-dependent epimerase/dehydratase family protein, partial [bacterium]
VDNFMFKQNSLLDYCMNPNLEVIRGDARDENLMKNLIKDKDYVLPFAALVGAPISSRDPFATVSINLEARRMLSKILSKEQRVILPTTNSGYGIGQDGIYCTEETPLNPISLYGKTNVESEKIYFDRGNVIVFRLATVFGASPRMRIDLLVNDFTYRAVKDRFVVLFESNFKRNYIHVRDVARAVIHGIENFDIMKNEPYNVGLSDANISKLELCQKIKKHIPDFVFMDAPIGEDPDKRNYIVSNEKIEKTGYKPKYSLDDGIVELKKAFTILTNSIYSNV